MEEVTPIVVPTTRDKSIELTFLPWVTKVNERVRLVLECIKDRKDNILETDYDILRALHGLWFTGEIPLFQTIQIPIVGHSVTQPELFTAKWSDDTKHIITVSDTFDDERDKILDGIKIVKEDSEPKIEE